MKFKYIKLLTKERKFVELPLIEIRLNNLYYLCLVDSGAEFCCFHGEIGERLGLKVREGREIKIRGITGEEAKAYFHKIKIKIRNREYQIAVGFSYQLGTPFGILGREGFFNLFEVCFYHFKKRIRIKADLRTRPINFKESI